MIAAFLTLIGFSVNDTIVIFDRIREIKGKTPTSRRDDQRRVNQTLSRTILTSLTAWLVVVILYVFGGEGLQGFSFCLVVGFLERHLLDDLHRHPDPRRLGPKRPLRLQALAGICGDEGGLTDHSTRPQSQHGLA